MSQVTADLLEAYLAEYGWTFQPLGEGCWATGFQGDSRLYPLMIRLSGTCVSFEIRPFVDLDADARRSGALVRELLELNGRMQVVKIALSESGELTLGCQVLTEGFDFDAFVRVVGILAYYADEVAPTIYSKIHALVRGPRQSRQPRLLS